MSSTTSPSKDSSARRPGPPRRDEQRAKMWSLFRFTATFLALVLSFSAMLQVSDAALSHRLCTATARVIAATLTLFGGQPVLAGATITYGAGAFQIVPECTGIEVIGLFVAAVLAFPSSWRHKLLGLAICIPLLATLNLVRMVTLLWVGARSAQALEYGHSYVWPPVVLAAAIAMWMLWMDVDHDHRRAD